MAQTEKEVFQFSWDGWSKENQDMLTSKFIILIFANKIDADMSKHSVDDIYRPEQVIRNQRLNQHILYLVNMKEQKYKSSHIISHLIVQFMNRYMGARRTVTISCLGI